MDALNMSQKDVEALPEEEAQEVLAQWVKAKRAELPEALAKSKSKPHARLAKKALYQLKSTGVAVAAPEKPQGEAVTLAQANTDDFPAVLSGVLGTGERALFFARPVRGGGLEIFQGVVSDEQGVMQLEAGSSNRSQYRRRLRELEGQKDVPVLHVTFERMKELLGEAMTLNERAKNPLNDDGMQLLRRLGIEPRDPDLQVPAPEAGDAELAKGSAKLHDEADLNQWLPSERNLEVLTKAIDELKESKLELTDAQKAEQREQKAKALAAEALTAEVRKIYARRLWRQAEVFEATDRPEVAKLARAEARQLFHTTEPSAFGERLFVKVLALSQQAGS